MQKKVYNIFWFENIITNKKVIVNRKGNIRDKAMKFTDAYCIGLTEHFDRTDSDMMTLQLTLSAGSITFGDKCEFKLID